MAQNSHFENRCLDAGLLQISSHLGNYIRSRSRSPEAVFHNVFRGYKNGTFWRKIGRQVEEL